MFKNRLKINRIDTVVPIIKEWATCFLERTLESRMSFRVMKNEGKIITCVISPGEYSYHKIVVIMWKIPFVKKIVCTPSAKNSATLEPLCMPHIITPIISTSGRCESR